MYIPSHTGVNTSSKAFFLRLIPSRYQTITDGISPRHSEKTIKPFSSSVLLTAVDATGTAAVKIIPMNTVIAFTANMAFGL